MRRIVYATPLLLGLAALIHAAAPTAPAPLVTGLVNPESVAVGPDGRIYVSVIGEFGKDGDGSIVVIDNGKAVPFATGLNDPKGLVAGAELLYVADKDRIYSIDKAGTPKLFVPPNAFPVAPMFLNDLALDPESGQLYVSDSGDLKGGGGVVYRITPKGLVEIVTDAKRLPGLHTPNGLLLDGAAHLLLADFGTGKLYRIKLADGSFELIAEGLGAADGLVWDRFGRLFTTDYKGGKVFAIARPGDKPVLVAEGLKAAADLCLSPSNKSLLVPDMTAGTVVEIPADIPGAELDQTPLALATEVAFPELKWTGWEGVNAKGQPEQLRPLVLTHAGDGSNRVFVATEQGVIHVFPNDPKATQTKVFLDIQDRVQYDDKTNEEGFLGLAFHPRYKQTGTFFVFYTPRNANGTNLVSRFRVSPSDPDKADPASEEVVLRITDRPFWNHDGGTLCFGPDGFLYVAVGDGGLANDPEDNGQSLGSLMGKVLRLDIDKKDPGLGYSIPKDNPFVGKEGARPEVWAWGFRNIWRMAFDRQTGQLWAADVGQNLWEEINLVQKGGNYGWNRREGLHPFGARGVGPRPDLIDPIWEYHHDIGKSVTGGTVYRGKRVPELVGHYVYADYVSGRIWALKYDEAAKRVVANRPIKDRTLPILSFGEDEQGEVYLLALAPGGKSVFRLAKTAK